MIIIFCISIQDSDEMAIYSVSWSLRLIFARISSIIHPPFNLSCFVTGFEWGCFLAGLSCSDCRSWRWWYFNSDISPFTSNTASNSSTLFHGASGLTTTSTPSSHRHRFDRDLASPISQWRRIFIHYYWKACAITFWTSYSGRSERGFASTDAESQSQASGTYLLSGAEDEKCSGYV